MKKDPPEMDHPREAIIPLVGLHCAACARRIERKLGRLAGVRSTTVNVALGQLRVTYESEESTLAAVIAALDEEGHDSRRSRVRLPFVDTTFGVVSARALEERVEVLHGVIACRVDLIREEVEVDFLPGEIEIDSIRKTVARCGYEISYPAAHPDVELPQPRRRRHGEKAHAATAVSAALLGTIIHLATTPRAGAAAGLLPHVEADPRLIAITLLVLAIGTLAWSMKSVLVSVARSIRFAYADTRLLVTLAIFFLLMSSMALFVAGEPAASPIVAALWLVALDRGGAVLDRRFKSRMTESATSLFSAMPHRIVVERDGVRAEVDAGTLRPGERVTVAPGETIPSDGHVHTGTSFIDARPLGGLTSIPVMVGDPVLAGSLNIGSEIVMEIERMPLHSFAPAATRLLEQTREKTTVENRCDRLARLGVPLALVVSIGVSVAALAVYGNAVIALQATAAALVAFALPAAGLAASAAMTRSRDHAVRGGVVFDSNASLERLAGIESITIDSSLLAGGDPVVSDFVLLAGTSQVELLAYASALTRGMDSPVSRGVATRCASISTVYEAADRIGIRGGGSSARVNEKQIMAGPPAALTEQAINIAPIEEEIEQWSAAGKSTLIIAAETSVIGAIALAPVINASDIAAVRELKSIGLKVNLLITGHPPAAAAVGRVLGATLVLSEPFRDRLPAALSSLGSGLLTTAIVAPAHSIDLFPRARLGIAVGVGRSPADPLNAPVTVTRSGTEPLLDILRSSRHAINVASSNLVIAAIGTLLALVFATGAFGIIPGLPVSPVAAMLVSSVASFGARANGMRVGRIR